MTNTPNNHPADILVVDDIQENLSLLVTILSKNGYHVRPASDGAFALTSARISPPDLILLDVNMPVMNGYMLCESLKTDERTRHIPVIFVSALDQPIVKLKAFKAGGVDYISKPFHAEEVLARVETHLSIARLQDDLKAKNKKLEEEILMRERVEHIMVHDLRNPLNSIRNFPTIIERQGSINQKQLQSLNHIKAAGSYMLKIINSTKDLAQIERGEYELNPGPVNIIAIIFDAVKEMHHEMELKNIDFKLLHEGLETTPQDKCLAWGEELLCHNVFSNLIKNAIEAAEKSDKITCKIACQKQIQVTIQNKQIVPEQIRNRFFDKYVTAAKKKGTGLGTYSARLATETMGGTITMETSDKVGTTVKVTLPKPENGISANSDCFITTDSNNLKKEVLTMKSHAPP